MNLHLYLIPSQYMWSQLHTKQLSDRVLMFELLYCRLHQTTNMTTVYLNTIPSWVMVFHPHMLCYSWFQSMCKWNSITVWDSISILEWAKNNALLQIKEALCIMLFNRKKMLNRDQGTVVSGCWGPLMRQTKRLPLVPSLWFSFSHLSFCFDLHYGVFMCAHSIYSS